MTWSGLLEERVDVDRSTWCRCLHFATHQFVYEYACGLFVVVVVLFVVVVPIFLVSRSWSSGDGCSSSYWSGGSSTNAVLDISFDMPHIIRYVQIQNGIVFLIIFLIIFFLCPFPDLDPIPFVFSFFHAYSVSFNSDDEFRFFITVMMSSVSYDSDAEFRFLEH